MRSTFLIGFALLSFACGDDSGGGGGAGGDASSSTVASGDGGAGPTTTGAGGILDDGTDDAIAACEVAYDAAIDVSTALGCEVPDREGYCADNAPTWVPCVAEWNAYFVCITGATTVETCECVDDGENSGISCVEETACADEVDAITACDEG